MLASDPEFGKQTDVFLFEYYTPKVGPAPSIVGLVAQFRGALEDQRVFEDHKSIVFLAHSMGGIIVRQFLLTRHDLAKIAMLYFYATLTNGAELARTAREISGNAQLRGLIPLEGTTCSNRFKPAGPNGPKPWPSPRTVPTRPCPPSASSSCRSPAPRLFAINRSTPKQPTTFPS
jgi:pimeloyl-ACP methyl ester carboxylesterase